jgi:hypothetical protein
METLIGFEAVSQLFIAAQKSSGSRLAKHLSNSSINPSAMHLFHTSLIVSALFGALVTAVPTATSTYAAPPSKRAAAADPMSTALEQHLAYGLSSMANGASFVAKVADGVAGIKPSPEKKPPQIPELNHIGHELKDIPHIKREAEPAEPVTTGEIKTAEKGAEAVAHSTVFKAAAKEGGTDFGRVAGWVGRGATIAQAGLDTATQALQANGHPAPHKKRGIHIPHVSMPNISPATEKKIWNGAKEVGQAALPLAPLLFAKE